MAVLRVFDRDFDVDAFLRDCPWAVSAIFRRGVARAVTGRITAASGFTFSISDSDFQDFAGQQTDAIAFLMQNAAEVKRLVGFAGVTGVELDFGIAWRDVAAQSDRFSAELVSRAGAFGLSLVLSHYPIS